MSEDVNEIIKMALSYENKAQEKQNSTMRMQKLMISELTYSQLEQIKMRSGIKLKQLIAILITAAYENGASSATVESDSRTRRWYVLMSEDVRSQLDQMCEASGGVSTGKMLGDIVYKVCSHLKENDATDIVKAIDSMDWGEA